MHHDKFTAAWLKEKFISELRRLVGIFIYFACFFFVFRLYTRLILSEYEVDYVEYGLTLVKALVLAKIILTADALRLGERFRERPLIVPTLYNTIVFVLFASVIEVLEHFSVGLTFERKSAAQLLAEVQEQGWPHIAAMVLVVFVAFIPFFAFRELERVLGPGKVRDLFVKDCVLRNDSEPAGE